MKIFLSRFDNLFSENRLLKVCCVLMVLVSACNGYFLYRLYQDNKTIITPYGCGGLVYEVGMTSVDDYYLLQMTRLVIDLRGNISPATVKERFSELLGMVKPSEYNRLRKQWMKEAEQIKQFPSVSYRIVWDGQSLERKGGHSVIVKATRERVTGKDLKESRRISFIMKYVVEHGRFMIKDISEFFDG